MVDVFTMAMPLLLLMVKRTPDISEENHIPNLSELNSGIFTTALQP